MAGPQQALRDAAIARRRLAAPLDMIGIHAKRHVLRVERQRTLEQEIGCGIERAVSKTGQMALAVRVLHHYASCFELE